MELKIPLRAQRNCQKGGEGPENSPQRLWKTFFRCCKPPLFFTGSEADALRVLLGELGAVIRSPAGAKPLFWPGPPTAGWAWY